MRWEGFRYKQIRNGRKMPVHPYLMRPEDLEGYQFSETDRCRFAILVDPAHAGRSLTVFLEIHEPGDLVPLHAHRAVETFFVLRGQGIFHCDGEEVIIRTGDCLMIPPRGKHDFSNPGPGRLYLLTVMVPNATFVEQVRAGIPAPLDAEDLQVLRSL